MSTATIRSGNDSFVKSSAPTGIYASNTQLRCVVPGTDTRYSFIYIKNPAPKGATVLSATLYLTAAAAFGASKTLTLSRVASAWSSTKLNWNNRPAVTGTTTSVTINAVQGQAIAFDVTAQFQTMADSGVNYGLRLSTSSTTELKLGSFNSSYYKPSLVIVWTLAPSAPIDLAPSGGSTVTLAKPVLQFNFHDIAGVTAMASCQVMLKATNTLWTAAAGFTTPLFDSGEVATSDPELDLSTTAYAGLAVSSTVWWTVRVKDDAGSWSLWSDPTSFNRGTRGALTINSPTVAIDDPTQQIIWTLTGATQTAYRVWVSDDSNPSVRLWDTGKISGTATSVTIPADVITREDTVYRITVWVWDVLTKTSTPGDTAHTEAVVALPFSSTGAADTIASFTLAPRASRQPGMVLSWTRPNAPDHYEIRRGDSVGTLKVVETDLDPADLLVSGTTYQYIDKTADAFRTAVWQVVAKTSTGVKWGPTASGAFTLDTTWLEHVESQRLVPILYRGSDDGPGDPDAPQISSVLQPVGAKHIIRTSQGQAGLQAAVKGVIVDSFGNTAKAWVNNLEWMRDHPWLNYRLSTGNKNINVCIGDVTIGPYVGGGAETGPNDRQVKFNYWEQ